MNTAYAQLIVDQAGDFMDRPIADISDLVGHMKAAKEGRERGMSTAGFAVLVGAGASASAGIPTSHEMVLELARKSYGEEASGEPPTNEAKLLEWLEDCEWYKRDAARWGDRNVDEGFLRYAVSMTHLPPARRRQYIQECCARAKAPNWTHLFLAQLMEEGCVDTVLTTNFDDLLRRALILFGKPAALCEHPENAAHVELTPATPQIVHLHGSATYYDTLHAPNEVDQLRGKLGAVLGNVVSHKGLLVLGYRGVEPDVMDALQQELVAHAPPYGLFWAHYEPGEPLSGQAGDLLNLWPADHRMVAISDSDEFLGELCGPAGLDLSLPPFVENPFSHGLAALQDIPPMPASAQASDSDLVAEARDHLQQAHDQLSDDRARNFFLEGVEYGRKDTPYALKQACEKYRAALEIKPDDHMALNNWGVALSELGKLATDAGDADAARKLHEQACEKYEQALEIKPDDHDALYNWGNALSELGTLATDADAARKLHEQACEKYEQALEIKPDSHEALYNWGIALRTLGGFAADAGDADAARKLHEQACEKYEQALEIKPDKHEALNNWGYALGELGKLATDAGDADAARKLHEQACEKYEQALAIKPDYHAALNNWGYALGELGKLATDADAARKLHEQACEKYEQALEIKPDKHEALNNWGYALGELGKLATDADAARKLHEQACEKYEQALEIKPDKHEALNNWGVAYSDLAHLSEGEERAHWLTEAERLVTEAEAIKPGGGI